MGCNGSSAMNPGVNKNGSHSSSVNQIGKKDNPALLERITHPRDGTKPAINTQYVRLYNHNLCPFSTRARYYLAAKGIKFQECMIDLNEKA